MKKIIIYIAISFILLITFIFVINYKKGSNRFKFGYGESIKLDKTEVIIDPITSDISNLFYKYSFIKGSNIALNKAIKGNNYTFISITLNSNIETLNKLQNNDTSIIKILEKKYSIGNNKRNFNSFFFKKSGMFIFRTVYSEPEYNDLVVYDILNSDSLNILKLYQTKNYIIKKINYWNYLIKLLLKN